MPRTAGTRGTAMSKPLPCALCGAEFHCSSTSYGDTYSHPYDKDCPIGYIAINERSLLALQSAIAAKVEEATGPLVEIVNLVHTIMGNGTMVVETINESALVMLYEQLGKPMPIESSLRNIAKDFALYRETTPPYTPKETTDE